MPDLTIEHRVVCAQNTYWQRPVHGKSGEYIVSYGHDPSGRYQYDWSCDCPGFKYRQKCRHIDEVKAERCTWGDSLDESEYTTKCPKCGGPTEVVRVAV